LFNRIVDSRRPARVSRNAADLRARLLLQPLETRAVPATFTVTNTNDDPTGATTGSLRWAITQANATAGADTINFSPTSFGSFQAIFLAPGAGQLTISDAVTITGPGASTLLITANGGSRAFNITDGTTTKIAVTLTGLSISGGRISTDGVSLTTAGDGAGIFMSNENVTLDGVVVTNNNMFAAPTDGGGGIGIAGGGLLTVRNSTISGNSTNGRGGGIYFLNGGALLVENSTISGNTSAPSPAAAASTSTGRC